MHGSTKADATSGVNEAVGSGLKANGVDLVVVDADRADLAEGDRE